MAHVQGIALYVLLVGADAEVVRAGLMGGLFVTAIALGRRSTAYISLFATVLVLALITPKALWDVGFQLSCAATLGLILFTPTIERVSAGGVSLWTGLAGRPPGQPAHPPRPTADHGPGRGSHDGGDGSLPGTCR